MMLRHQQMHPVECGQRFFSSRRPVLCWKLPELWSFDLSSSCQCRQKRVDLFSIIKNDEAFTSPKCISCRLACDISYGLCKWRKDEREEKSDRLVLTSPSWGSLVSFPVLKLCGGRPTWTGKRMRFPYCSRSSNFVLFYYFFFSFLL